MTADLKERVDDFLWSLGDTADEVAHALENLGAYGCRDDGCACPIANALRLEFPQARESNGAEWDDDEGRWFVCAAYIRVPGFEWFITPKPVASFIRYFDSRVAYGELEEAARAEQ